MGRGCNQLISSCKKEEYVYQLTKENGPVVVTGCSGFTGGHMVMNFQKWVRRPRLHPGCKFMAGKGCHELSRNPKKR